MFEGPNNGNSNTKILYSQLKFSIVIIEGPTYAVTLS